MRGLDRILLKNIWLVLLLCVAYIFWRQGWPAPAFDAMVVKATAASFGALLGMWVDARHFKAWTPKTDDPSPVNMLRRAAVICVGMLAVSLAV